MRSFLASHHSGEAGQLHTVIPDAAGRTPASLQVWQWEQSKHVAVGSATSITAGMLKLNLFDKLVLYCCAGTLIQL